MRLFARIGLVFGVTPLILMLLIWTSLADAQDADAAAPSKQPYADACPDPLTRESEPRPKLNGVGITYCINYTGESLGTASGGIRRGAVYEGRLEVSLDADLKTWLWSGARFHASADQIHGRGLSANYLGNNILTASSNEAERSTRLFTLWLQHQEDDVVSVRVGQLAADDEFAQSKTAGAFVNSTFGWPGIMASDLPSGGPVYPLATPGVRVSVGPQDGFSLMAAVFNGDPAGPGRGTPQSRDGGGTAFRLNDGAFVVAEAIYGKNQKDGDAGVPGALKLGVWFHSGRFADERFDSAGLSLASPASSRIPAEHRGDFGFYAIADWMIVPKEADKSQGLAAFLRLAGSPSDRNLVGFYADGGVAYTGLFDDAKKDVLGLGVAYARISDAASGLDRDVRFFTGTTRPVRDYELALEVTYRAPVRPWWIVQPDLQFIFHPAGHAPDPTDPTARRPIRDAVVLGVRTTVSF